MGGYAHGTKVPVERSQGEIRKLLAKKGADSICIGESVERGVGLVQFSYEGMNLQVTVRLPKPNDQRFWKNASGYRLPPGQAEGRYRAELRRVWRVLLIMLKSRFEEIDSELFSAVEVLMPFLLLPDGSTIAEKAGEGVAKVLETGNVAGLLMSPACKQA